MKRILFALIALSVIQQAVAQGYVSPSADVQAATRLTNAQVNHFSGNPIISIPLATVGGSEIDVSIGLDHNASGFKVQDIAGITGLGWSLQAGGYISRVVRGEPDESTDGFCNSGTNTNKDQDPDLYFFSIPGMSGKFILDKNKKPVLVPYKPVIIRPGICLSGNPIWYIIDQNGVTYRFGMTEADREKTTTQRITPVGTIKEFTSVWFLSEIESPNKTDKIVFEYQPNTIKEINYFFSEYQLCTSTPGVQDESTEVIRYSKVIQKITASGGSATFEYKNKRRDIENSLYLNTVTIKDHLGDQVNKFFLGYGYFGSHDCEDAKCKRLRLDRIEDLAPDPLYSFSYNFITDLPPMNSKEFDHWGYYNTNTVTKWTEANRNPDPVRSLANILTGITSRTGGNVVYEYEPHIVYDATSQQTSSVGGARVKRITVNDGKGNSYEKTFKYLLEGSNPKSSGIRFRKLPRYYSTVTANLSGGPQVIAIQTFSHAYTELFDVNGLHCGYSRVEEVVTGKGRSVYHFSNYDLHPDIERVDIQYETDQPPFVTASSYAWERGNLEALEIYDEGNDLVSAQINEFEYNNPVLSQVTGVKRYVQTFNCTNLNGSYPKYGFYDVISKALTLKKQTTRTFVEPNREETYREVITEFTYDPVTYQQIKATQYDARIPDEKRIQEFRYVTNIDYRPDREPECESQRVSCASSCDNEPDQQVRDACYQGCGQQKGYCMEQPPPFADNATLAILKLLSRNQIGTPIETLTEYQKGGNVTVLSSTLNIYGIGGTSGNHVNLKEIWAFNQPVLVGNYGFSEISDVGLFSQDVRLRKKESYTVYNATSGNLEQQISSTGIQTSYTWDASNNYVLATETSGGITTTNRSETFKPMVGKLTTTDMNGRVSRQEYDVYNRPSIVRDNDGNIQASVRYHYKNETPGFRIQLIPNRQDALVNSSVTFKAVDIATSIGDRPKFLWDFGDGTILENNSLQVDHAYATPGTYTVKLVGTHPDYPPSSRSLTMSINNPMQVTTCSNGPIYIDLCDVDPPVYGTCSTPATRTVTAPLVVTVTPTIGCSSSYTYYWDFKNSLNNTWQSLESTSRTVTYQHYMLEGVWEIRCTITDACGNQVQRTTLLNIYRSNPSCPIAVH